MYIFQSGKVREFWPKYLKSSNFSQFLNTEKILENGKENGNTGKVREIGQSGTMMNRTIEINVNANTDAQCERNIMCNFTGIHV